MKPNSLARWVMLTWLSHMLFASQLGAAQAGEGIGMVTGSSTGTYIQFGQDIAKVAQGVGLEILVKESEGSIDNIRRLVSAENAGLGIVQSDVLGFLSRSPDPQVRHVAGRLRLIFPFYNEEVHLFARHDIRRFEDLAGRRIVVGTQGSGNWLTSNNLLRIVNVKPAERIELPPPEAASAVLTGQADAMFYVVGKPAKLFTAMLELQKDPRYAQLAKEVHFVPLTHAAILREYVASAIGPNDYAWLNEQVPTVAVKAVLVSFDFSRGGNPYYQQRCGELGKLGQVIRDNFAELQRTGHPKWREVDLDQEVGIWKRDTCSQVARRAPKRAPQTEEDLLRSIADILKGKGQAR
jgi:TRAP transporter TAXI family solute receptor